MIEKLGIIEIYSTFLLSNVKKEWIPNFVESLKSSGLNPRVEMNLSPHKKIANKKY